jgi:hypothetical protein
LNASRKTGFVSTVSARALNVAGTQGPCLAHEARTNSIANK